MKPALLFAVLFSVVLAVLLTFAPEAPAQCRGGSCSVGQATASRVVVRRPARTVRGVVLRPVRGWFRR
jgi:hypothetical protein